MTICLVGTARPKHQGSTFYAGVWCVCIFELSEMEQKAKGNRKPDKTVWKPKETSAHNFSVSIATAAEALCRFRRSSDFPAALFNTQFRLVGQ